MLERQGMLGILMGRRLETPCSPANDRVHPWEQKRFPAATLDALKARGHDIRELDMTSGLQAIQKTAGGYFGGADPRREGLVMGD